MCRPSSVFPSNIFPACPSRTNTPRSRSTSETASSSWTIIRTSSMSSSPIPLTQRDQRRACSRSHTLSYSLELSKRVALSPHKVVRSPMSCQIVGVSFGEFLHASAIAPLSLLSSFLHRSALERFRDSFLGNVEFTVGSLPVASVFNFDLVDPNFPSPISPPLWLPLLTMRRFQRLTNFFCTAENQWLHLPLITKLKKDCKEVFPTVEYAYTTIPTYPSGQIGFMVCCKDAKRNLKEPLRSFTAEEEEKLCKYYNADIHRASFVLPTFARAALK